MSVNSGVDLGGHLVYFDFSCYDLRVCLNCSVISVCIWDVGMCEFGCMIASVCAVAVYLVVEAGLRPSGSR